VQLGRSSSDRGQAGASAAARGRQIAIPWLLCLLAACALAYPAAILLYVTGGKVLAGCALALGSVGYARLEEARPWLLGAGGERRVGRELDRLKRSGWTVRHDIRKRGGGNIDHLVCGPRGVFTIETKLSRFCAADLRQARSHAHVARRWFACQVTPVLCVARSKLEPRCFAGVWCVGSPHLVQFLRSDRDWSAQLPSDARGARSGLRRRRLPRPRPPPSATRA
jgi:hypothetical protein